MPYLDLEDQRRYQREWVARRRREWIEANGPCVDCSGTEDLEVDHDDASTKGMPTASIWSRRQEVREAELAKCVVRCWHCHVKKTRERGEHARDGQHGQSILRAAQVSEARRLFREAGGIPFRKLGERYGVGPDTIRRAVRGYNGAWQYLDEPPIPPSRRRVTPTC